jgi:hypothetical protein
MTQSQSSRPGLAAQEKGLAYFPGWAKTVVWLMEVVFLQDINGRQMKGS